MLFNFINFCVILVLIWKEEIVCYLKRIVIDPKIMVGKPVIAGTRITVEQILTMIAQGMEKKEILKEYPHLNQKDIQAAVAYAQRAIKDEKVYPLVKGKLIPA